MHNVVVVAQGTSEKKEGKEVTEDALAVKQMRKYISREIERRKAKEKLKKHLGSNYHQYKNMQSSLNKPAQKASSTKEAEIRNDICFYSQKPGHFKKDCPAFNKLKTGDKKDRRNFKRSHRALLTEERKKIQLQLDALDIESDFEDEDSDDSTLPSPEMCGVSHEVIDFGQKKKEICGMAEEIFPDISNN